MGKLDMEWHVKLGREPCKKSADAQHVWYAVGLDDRNLFVIANSSVDVTAGKGGMLCKACGASKEP